MANFAILVPILWLVAIVLLIVLEAVTYQLVAIGLRWARRRR